MVNLKGFFLCVVCLIIVMGCGTETNSSEDEEEIVEETFPTLQISNTSQCSSTLEITSVSLVGYDFNSLSLIGGESQTFTLSDGMYGGYNDINVNVGFRYGSRSWSNSIKVDFEDGIETVILLKITQNCGSSDVYLEEG
jgi:hypothetical protein